MSVFSKDNSPEGGINRVPYDLSYQNNITGKMGYLYPCICKEVISGDTWKIDVDFGIRFMPTAFPLQTKIRAYIDFFYLRDRNLWHGWKNWFTGVGKPEDFPVLSSSEKMEQSKTGSLGDYLGLPSTIVGPYVSSFRGSAFIPPLSGLSSFNFHPSNTGAPGIVTLPSLSNTSDKTQFVVFLETDSNGNVSGNGSFSSSLNDNLHLMNKVTIDGVEYAVVNFQSALPSEIVNGVKSGSLAFFTSTSYAMGRNSVFAFGQDIYNSSSSSAGVSTCIFNPDTPDRFYVKYSEAGLGNRVDYFGICVTNENSTFPVDYFALPEIVAYQQTGAYHVQEATDVLNSIPYDVSVLPFRGYEQIYNAFYRDDRNNPYMVDGYVDPNVFLPTYDGGTDNNQYRLHKANWEQDFLTTALPSPQYGYAPLVGITSSGVASFTDSDGNVVTSRLSVGDDGDTVVGFETTADASVNRSLVSLAQSGISINDFRGVNSLQRYLEAKYRKGLKYRDQILSHFGVDVRYDELDMPEFIGSVSQSVAVTQINQNSASDTDPLGSYAGQLSCVGSGNSMQHYCDEPGFIIGILRVVPVPVYSQLLPKHFLKTTDPLDYYSPEFAHLGFQPIKYNEVCPLQAANQDVSLDSTFGYQRAWYDYLASTDEIHGQFRTTLNNFILARVFNSVPSLNEEFLTVDPDSMNDVFTVNEVNGEPVDTFLGQLHFRLTVMRQIPRYGVPRLE